MGKMLTMHKALKERVLPSARHSVVGPGSWVCSDTASSYTFFQVFV